MRNWLQAARLWWLGVKRKAAPPPPPTQIEELVSVAEEVVRVLSRFGYKLEDAVQEGLVTQSHPLTAIITAAKFQASRLRDESLLELQRPKDRA